jgi:hypothetical protein
MIWFCVGLCTERGQLLPLSRVASLRGWKWTGAFKEQRESRIGREGTSSMSSFESVHTFVAHLHAIAVQLQMRLQRGLVSYKHR